MSKEQDLVSKEKFLALKKSFIENVESKSGGFEPHDNYCWRSVITGYALANGFSHDEAYQFAREMSL
ncbi:hypothetical protein [Vibrio alginolyticus]|uniref:hypothetical protein n=1 Tax=Vibrio alginolyticus TaxID=663 RepID=UPI001BD4DBEE|nr:hypothetical protein [Vibrio alginolyticus]MBS9829218.1 hypothetical protein [Vibrio alginolyticus]